MTSEFDKPYWDSHWQQSGGSGAGREIAPNPYLAAQTSSLAPGTALDAGCGEGAEALWLAAEGWQVTAADISSEVITRAARRAKAIGAAGERLTWVEADLSTWEPREQFDLVTTHYAHPAMPQLDFYQRISRWVAPGGTLLIVGHLQIPGTAGHNHNHGQGQGHGDGHDGHGHDGRGHDDDGHHPAEDVSVTAASITAVLDAGQWEVVTADEDSRTLTNRGGSAVDLHDVIVRATRRR